MDTISYVSSLMEFNTRVLYQGYVGSLDDKLSLEELKKKLFFNQVFYSNTIEMFQKHQMFGMADDYLEGVNALANNVFNIIRIAHQYGVMIDMSGGSVFEARLETEKLIDGQVISQEMSSMMEIKNFYKWDSNTIYYISIIKGKVIISHIDRRRRVYQVPLKFSVNGLWYYYKTDYAIRKHVMRLLGADDTVAVRVISDMKSNAVTRVEYVGNAEMMKQLLSMFPSDCLIMSNPFIYMDDIKQTISENMIVSEISKAKCEPINFDDIFMKDRLIEFPNESFDEYLQFLRNAVFNEATTGIYLTLYRVGDSPAIYYILRDAINKGIKVHVNIELMATGESINQMWYRELKGIGAHVTTYACGKLKVHTKLTLIEFMNGTMVCQIGTGNYHTQTTSQYTDLCFITADEEICKQAYRVFRIMDGHQKADFGRDFLVTRYNARDEIITLIDREGKKGEDGYIAIKCNSLDDIQVINAMRKAAMNGCTINAVVRGVCTWVPRDLPNVMIKSIVWDKLEHSRVFCFGHTNPDIYLGSLDLVTNKIDKRIETLVRIKDPDIVLKVSNYLNRYITNTCESWVMTETGAYIKE